MAARAKARLTRGESNCAWIERHCRIPEGKFVGRPVKLTKKQKKWICRIYDTPTRLFILSMGRKGAKTTFAAFLLLLHLCGPEAVQNGHLFSDAQSRDQAAILFALAAKIVRMSPDLADAIAIRDTAKELICRELGTVYEALSAEAATAFGVSPVFIVHDELGQVKGPRSPLYEAMETASAAQENPLSVIISTQAPTDADLLSVLIDDALSGADPRIKVEIYTAPLEMDPFGEEAIRAANPHFDDFMNKEEVFRQAADAKRMPSREAAYRNLILNQRVEARNPFVTRTVWEENGAQPLGVLRGAKVYGGLDLSSVSDLTRFGPGREVRRGLGRLADVLVAGEWVGREIEGRSGALRPVGQGGQTADVAGLEHRVRIRRGVHARGVRYLRCPGHRFRPLQLEVSEAVAGAGRIH